MSDSAQKTLQPDWEAAWLAELDRRTAAAEHRSEESNSEWTDVRARILERLGQPRS